MQEENQPFLPGGTARPYASRCSLTTRTPSVLAAAVGRFPLGSRDPAGIVTFQLKCPPPAAACKTGEQNGAAARRTCKRERQAVFCLAPQFSLNSTGALATPGMLLFSFGAHVNQPYP